jgi:hypothetical protein
MDGACIHCACAPNAAAAVLLNRSAGCWLMPTSLPPPPHTPHFSCLQHMQCMCSLHNGSTNSSLQVLASLKTPHGQPPAATATHVQPTRCYDTGWQNL